MAIAIEALQRIGIPYVYDKGAGNFEFSPNSQPYRVAGVRCIKSCTASVNKKYCTIEIIHGGVKHSYMTMDIDDDKIRLLQGSLTFPGSFKTLWFTSLADPNALEGLVEATRHWICYGKSTEAITI